MTLTFKAWNALMLIAGRSFFFTALQFVAITRYDVSLRFAKKKQQRTLNTTQLRILGLNDTDKFFPINDKTIDFAC